MFALHQYPNAVPRNAVILNMALCEICKEPFLLDSSESAVCGRAKCIAVRMIWGITLASKIEHGHEATGPDWWQKEKAAESEQRKREHKLREAMYGGSTADLVKARRHGGYARATDGSELTPKEISILQGAADGYSYRLIGEHLGTSEQTVKNCARTIFDKLGCEGITRAVVIAIGRGLIKGAAQPEVSA